LKCRAKDVLPVVLDDGTVSNDDLIEIPIKYPLHRRTHASAICNIRLIKTCESATGKGADNYAGSVRKAGGGGDDHRRVRGNRYPNPGCKRLQILAEFLEIFLVFACILL
jgi:hypothetical protein